jgi:hypothetical protein
MQTVTERVNFPESLGVGLGPGFRETEGDELAVAVTVCVRVTRLDPVGVLLIIPVLVTLLSVAVYDTEEL